MHDTQDINQDNPTSSAPASSLASPDQPSSPSRPRLTGPVADGLRSLRGTSGLRAVVSFEITETGDAMDYKGDKLKALRRAHEYLQRMVDWLIASPGEATSETVPPEESTAGCPQCGKVEGHHFYCRIPPTSDFNRGIAG